MLNILRNQHPISDAWTAFQVVWAGSEWIHRSMKLADSLVWNHTWAGLISPASQNGLTSNPTPKPLERSLPARDGTERVNPSVSLDPPMNGSSSGMNHKQPNEALCFLQTRWKLRVELNGRMLDVAVKENRRVESRVRCSPLLCFFSSDEKPPACRSQFGLDQDYWAGINMGNVRINFGLKWLLGQDHSFVRPFFTRKQTDSREASHSHTTFHDPLFVYSCRSMARRYSTSFNRKGRHPALRLFCQGS
jgi:hypothetical protein